MRYLHTMIRVRDLEKALDFFIKGLGMVETRRIDRPQHKYMLVFLAASEDVEAAKANKAPEIELTYNYDTEDYGTARNFGHLAFVVDDIYAACERLRKMGVTINRPPRDGHMAFVRSPDLISIELLQKGGPKPPAEPWSSMPNTGVW